MTWQELADKIEALTPEQQSLQALVEDNYDGEFVKYIGEISELLIENGIPIIGEPSWRTTYI